MAEFTPRVLQSATGRLTAYDHGAHVAEWVREGTDVLWLSDRAVYQNDRSIRGGVPICWPWFAAGPDGDISPTHGFLRLTGWRLVEAGESTLRWGTSSEMVVGRPGVERFPYPFEAQVAARLTDELEVSLTVHNTGPSPLDYEAALHTYVHVGDVQAITIEGLDGVGYWDKVTRARGTQHGPLRLTGETDRIHDSADPLMLDDPVLGRRLVLTPSGATRTVIWNPWRAGADELADMADGSWRRMVCLEAAAIGAGRVRLGTGERHTISQRVSVTGVASAPTT